MMVSATASHCRRLRTVGSRPKKHKPEPEAVRMWHQDAFRRAGGSGRVHDACQSASVRQGTFIVLGVSPPGKLPVDAGGQYCESDRKPFQAADEGWIHHEKTRARIDERMSKKSPLKLAVQDNRDGAKAANACPGAKEIRAARNHDRSEE